MENLDKELLKLFDDLDYSSLVNTTLESINLKTDYPYIVFERKHLVNALNLCSKITVSKASNTIYNSLTLVPVPSSKSLYFYTTNALSHFRYKTELLGSEDELIKDNISIPIITLQKLIKLMSDKVLIYEKEGFYYIRLLDGDLIIDAKNYDSDLVFFPAEPDSLLAEIELSSLGKVIDSIKGLLDIKSSNNKLNFLGEKAFIQTPLYYVEAKIKTPTLTLSNKDSEFLSRLSKYYPDNKLLLYNVKSNLPRVYLKLDNVEYEFINSKINSNSIDISGYTPDFTVDFKKIDRIIALAGSLPNTSNIIQLDVSDDNLSITLDTNSNKSVFNISINKINQIIPISVKLNSSIIRKLFNESNVLKFKISSSNIYIESDNIKSLLLTYCE